MGADVIIHLNGDSYGLVEIKLGRHRIEEGVTNLLKLKNKVDTAYTQEPKFLMVLTGSGLAYRRKEDGIYVVPNRMLEKLILVTFFSLH